MEKAIGKATGCAKCGAVCGQIKKGFTGSGSQRIFCKHCKNKYVPVKKHYSLETKQQAVKLYMSGMSARKVGKLLGMKGDTVTAWIIFFLGKSAIRQSPPK